jgi:beta-glucosidase
MVADSLVLLKNRNAVLGRMNEFKHILIVGPAHEVGTQMGGWSISWQGSASSPDHIGTSVIEGVLEALQANILVEGTALPSEGTYANAARTVYVTYAAVFGAVPSGFSNPEIPPFDVAIGVVAEIPYAGEYGDVRTGAATPDARIPLYNLPEIYDLPDASGGRGSQRAQRGHAANQGIIEGFAAKDGDGQYVLDIPKIVLMIAGRPHSVDIHLGDWDALIAAWLPGSEGGGIADVVFGSRDFAGKTPVTWYGVYEEIADPVTGSSVGRAGNITFPFGWGLKKSEDLTHPHQVYVHEF